MKELLAIAAAVAASGFTLDLALDARRRHRPHVTAYAAGMAMFAIASWALAVGLITGWTEASYRVFFLFGAILNIPMLAVGSTFLVIGRRAGHVAFLVTGAISAMATTLTMTVPFTNPLPEDGIPNEIFGTVSDGFGPALFAMIGGAGGGTVLIVLSLISVFRFWKKNRRIVMGNILIVLGTFSAAAGGSILRFIDDDTSASITFEAFLFLAATLIWLGYRVTRGSRSAPRELPTITLAGPSVENPERAHVEVMIGALERAGYRVICPARDIEDWGNVGYSPEEATRLTCRAIDESGAVVVDLHHGYGVVFAGYAFARGVPVIMATPEGSRIARPLRGVATREVYYRSVDDVVERLVEVLPPGTPSLSDDRVPEPA